MEVLVREAESNEYEAIHDLVKRAFETAPVSDGDEQDYVLYLRASERHIFELELVAEDDDIIIGHIMLTKTKIETNEKVIQELLLSPISVQLEYRNKGVGKLLVKESFEIAKRLGYSAVFVVGDPEYYLRFGFKQTTNFGIKNKSDIEEKYVMACELHEGYLKNKERNNKYYITV
ncbi:MAG: N-acetyltransferase [Oscillospiraceae bacterium]|nr:N-acetyltransferase [Oscillospiraceae bacterium]